MADVTNPATEAVEEAGKMAQFINEYGAATVILSVFLVIFIILIIYLLLENRKYKKEKDENTKLAITNKSSVENDIKELKNAILNTGKKNKDTRKGISDFINRNAIMKSACKEALSALKCSRVAVYVFHNGNMSLHGFSFYKMSCIGEWSKNPNGVTRGMTHYQMPLHMFERIISELCNTGEFFVKDVSGEDLESNSIYNFICNTRIKSFYMKAILDEEGNPAGFTICEFNLDSTETEDTIREVLQKLNDKVSPIILSTDIDLLVDGTN